MQISPITSYKNQTSFQAINLKYLQKAQKIHRKGWYHGELINCIGAAVYFGSMSKQDAIETMEAIKPYIGESEKWIWQDEMEYVKSFEN